MAAGGDGLTPSHSHSRSKLKLKQTDTGICFSYTHCFSFIFTIFSLAVSVLFQYIQYLYAVRFDWEEVQKKGVAPSTDMPLVFLFFFFSHTCINA